MESEAEGSECKRKGEAKKITRAGSNLRLKEREGRKMLDIDSETTNRYRKIERETERHRRRIKKILIDTLVHTNSTIEKYRGNRKVTRKFERDSAREGNEETVIKKKKESGGKIDRKSETRKK